MTGDWSACVVVEPGQTCFSMFQFQDLTSLMMTNAAVIHNNSHGKTASINLMLSAQTKHYCRGVQNVAKILLLLIRNDIKLCEKFEETQLCYASDLTD